MPRARTPQEPPADDQDGPELLRDLDRRNAFQLMIGGTPQCVQGFALRHAGRLAKWSPDAETAVRLTRMPSDAVGIQYCHPKSTVQNLCCIAPLFVGQLGMFSDRNSPEFNPTEVGLIPNGHELSSHLFPNLTFTRDDGRTVRIDVRESFSLPLEFIGFEALAFGATLELPAGGGGAPRDGAIAGAEGGRGHG